MGKLGKAFLFLLAVMLLFTATSRAAASFTVAQVRVETPQARKIVHTVRGEGIVEKMGEQPVYAAADILVAQIYVKEGQSVEKGDVLARLDIESINENIRRLSDEIRELELQNQSIAEREQKEAEDRSKAGSRAREDYDNILLDGEAQKEQARQRIEDAKEEVKDAKAQARRQADEAYEKKYEELRQAVKAAQKSYDEAKEKEKETLLAAKRALEDASKAPGKDYGIELLQLQITQKQQEISRLYLEKWEGTENINSLASQIISIQTEIAALELQLKEKTDAAAKQEQERAQMTSRAQEDYDKAAETCARLVSDAEEAWDEAQMELDEFLEGEDEDISKDPSVKAAKEALKDAKQQKEDEKRQQEAKQRQAKRALEDAAQGDVPDHTAEVNRIAIEKKKQQLDLLEEAKKEDGKIAAGIDGTITQVQLVVGQKTSDTAAFLLSDSSGGMSFTTQISKEDAVYVTAGDVVAMESADQTCEDMEILSVETNEDESVQVTVYVPKDTFPLGTYASMELTKQSREYAVTVPVTAVHTENEKNFVYVMEPEDTVLGGQYVAMRMEVAVQEKNGLYAAITDSSLTAESQVILDSDRMISAGETVRLQEE